MLADLYDHHCTRCPLHEDVTTVCMAASGDPGRLSHAMVVGEAPGRDEDAAGRPFVGRSGALLDQALSLALGTLWDARQEIVVTNVVKCRPPGNRTPTQREMQACHMYLQEEIARLDPFVILALGNAAIWALLREVGITRIRGDWQRLDRDKETWVMPTYHPAFIGYQGGVGSQAWKAFVDDTQVFINRMWERING